MSVPPPTEIFDPGLITAVIIAGACVVVVALVALVMSHFLKICEPHEILIFSGRKHRLPDGTEVGYKLLHGGRGFRVPLLEEVSRMDVRLFGVEVSVGNAFSRGGIPLTVQAIANVKISTDPVLVRQAVERFLGVPPAQIQAVARQTLEGVLREVLSQLTPEEVNEDRLKFAATLVENAKDDFDKIGLELDVLKVQHVSDEQKYLQNLGRARIAGMLRDAENAENLAEQIVSQAQAGAHQRAESAGQQAEAIVLQSRNGFRGQVAKLEADALGIELEAGIAAETARALAEQELQRLRAELAKVTLEVERVLPAEAAAAAAVARARGDAAPTLENGKAVALALRSVASEWIAAGELGRELYVLQQLDAVIASAVRRVEQIQIDGVEVVDGGDGESLAAVASAFPRSVTRVLDETGRALGIDVHALLGPTPTPSSSSSSSSSGSSSGSSSSSSGSSTMEKGQ